MKWRETMCRVWLRVQSHEGFNLLIIKFGALEIRIRLNEDDQKRFCAAILSNSDDEFGLGGWLKPAILINNENLDQDTVGAKEI